MARERKKSSRQYIILVRPKAAEDLETISDYIALDSPSNAERFVARLLVAIEELHRFPERYPVARESEGFGFVIRQRVIGRYRVLYTVEASSVRILRVRSTFQESLSPDEDSLQG